MKRRFWMKKIMIMLLIAAVAIPLFGFIIMSLWNAILPSVIHVSPITFWQALGIFVLSKLLFGGFHGGRGGRRESKWKFEMMNKWQNMSPEERDKWKQEMRNRCRTWGRGYNEQEPPAQQEESI
jgi:hypothetical protein